MRLLDLFCCEGGAATGYARAGFSPYGVDIDPQPLYPFPFHQGDAIEVLARLNAGLTVNFTHPDGSVELLAREAFVAAHGSPPCQAYSTITPDPSKHPELIQPTRAGFEALGLPYIIENVAGAVRELRNPVKLCGSSFGLRVRRHRFFESNLWLTSVPCDHGRQGRPVGVYGDHGQNDHEYRRPDGTLRGAKAINEADARDAMGMPWASWNGLREAIPPAFTEWLGHQLGDALALTPVPANGGE